MPIHISFLLVHLFWMLKALAGARNKSLAEYWKDSGEEWGEFVSFVFEVSKSSIGTNTTGKLRGGVGEMVGRRGER